MAHAISYLASIFIVLHLSPGGALADPCPCSLMNAEGVASGKCGKGEDSTTMCRMEWEMESPPCGCSALKAESVAKGTCSKGEDSTTLCRMEWDGGSADKTTASAFTAAQGRLFDNAKRYNQVDSDDHLLAGVVRPYLEQWKIPYPKSTYARVGSIERQTESRVAAQVIDRQLWRDSREELAWPVIYLATRAYFPFAERPRDDTEALTRILASTVDRWTPSFAAEAQPVSIDVSDDARGLQGLLSASADCLDVRIGTVLVMVRGPRSKQLNKCQG